MTWIVGVDPAPGHEGPLQLAAWLKRHNFIADDRRLLAVHVTPQTGFAPDGVGADLIAEARERTQKMIDDLLQRSLASGAISELRQVDANTVSEGLADAAKGADADTIVAGRRSPRGEARLVRLGPVVRRLLRRLPTTIVVTPPDLGARGTGDGPIIVATDLEPHSVAAAQRARSLAEALDRPLMVAYVAPIVGFAQWSEPLLAEACTDPRHIAGLREWCSANGLEKAGLLKLCGEPVAELTKASRDHDAAFLVAGSRRLSTSARLFSHSLSSELAANAWVPVMVVPAD